MGQAKRRKELGVYPEQTRKPSTCYVLGHSFGEWKYIGTTYNHDGFDVEVFERRCSCGCSERTRR